jgi:hypothetical protein
MRLKALWIGVGIFFLIVIVGMRPDSLPFIPRTLFSDAVISHYPSALFLRQSVLEQHTFPLWRETIMAGQPFAANPLNKTAYPFQWLALLLPPTLHLNVMIALHLFIAGCGMWLWSRAMGMCEESAAFSAFAYAFAPRIIAHMGAGHLDVVYAMAWFPWLMWTLRETFEDSREPERFASTYRLNLVRTGLLAAMVFLADVRVGLFVFATAGVYAAMLMLRSKQRAVIAVYAASIVVFLGLVVELILPLLGWSPYLSRAGLSLEDAGAFSMDLGNLFSLILPAHGFNHEQFTYFGLPVLLLAGIAIIRQTPRMRLLWLVAIVFIVLYSLGIHGFLWSLLVQLVPALLWFRVPARVWLILVLLMPMLAGWGLQYLIDWKPELTPVAIKRWRLVTIALTAIIGASGAALIPFLVSGGIALLFVGVPLGVLMMLVINGRISGQRLAVGLAVLLSVDLAWAGNRWAEWRLPETWLSVDAPLAERLVSLNPQRIYSPTYSLEQQVAATYGLQIFGGVDPFQLRGVVRAIEQGSGVPVVGYNIVLPPLLGIEGDDSFAQANRDAIIDTAILGEWGVSHVVVAHPIENTHLQLIDEVDGVYIYANTDTVRPLTNVVPDWAEGWEGLPSAEEVTRLNNLTLTTASVSAVVFIFCVGLLVILKLRSNV